LTEFTILQAYQEVDDDISIGLDKNVHDSSSLFRVRGTATYVIVRQLRRYHSGDKTKEEFYQA